MFWLSLVEQLRGNKVTMNANKEVKEKPKAQVKEVAMVQMVQYEEQDDDGFFVVEEDDCDLEPAKTKNVQPAKTKNEQLARTMPVKTKNVFLIDDSPSIDDGFKQKQKSHATPDKLDASSDNIRPCEVEGPVEARNVASNYDGSDDEYDKYLDQLESAGDFESDV